MTQVAVVILNWNKAALTQRCLRLAQESTARPVQWIVVDNASDEPMGELPAGTVLIQHQVNSGFTGGVNAGLKRALEDGADYVWLLNNDAEAAPGALDALVDVAEADPSVGLASSVVLNSDEDDLVEFHGGYTENGIILVTRDAAEYERWRRDTPERIWLVGTAMLVRRELIERVGFFDDALFAYNEDVDLSRRSVAAGFRNVVVPGSVVRHPAGKPGEVTTRPPYYYYYMTRNDLLTLRKMRDPARTWYWALRRSWRWSRDRRLAPPCRRAIRRGVVDGLLGRGGPMR